MIPSSTMSRDIPGRIIDNIRSMLSYRAGGFPLSEFLSDYRNFHNEALGFRDLGFTSLPNFLKAIPHVARLVSTDEDFLICKAVEGTKASSDFQKETSPVRMEDTIHTNGFQHSKSRQFNRNQHLVPDPNGLWSVCLLETNFPKDLKANDLTAYFNQAGQVVKTFTSNGRIFIRYKHKEEALLAEEIYSDLGVTIANNHLKTNDKNQAGKSNCDLNQSFHESNKRNQFSQSQEDQQKHWKDKKYTHNVKQYSDQHSARNGDSEISKVRSNEKTYSNSRPHHGTQAPDFSGSSTSFAHNKFGDRGDRLHSNNRTDTVFSSTSLYVNNIESVDEFREMIKPYKPVNVIVKINQGKQFAFVDMESEADAQEVINNLDRRQQQTKTLFVTFRKYYRNDNESVSGDSESSYGARSRKMNDLRQVNHVSEQQSMPPLEEFSAQEITRDSFYLECLILVTNFPSKTLESSLRGTFEKYHVLDICMVNNGSGPGCTKAYLYLSNVYDVIQAVLEMNGSCVYDKPINVIVPHHCDILKAVVEKVRKHNRSC